MIGRLTGTLIEVDVEGVLVDVGGVGYEVEVPVSTLSAIGKAGDPVVLHTHFVVRDDAQLLFGFATHREREMFRTLIKVNKVGPKLGLAILSGVEVNELIRAVRDEDVKVINGISGVGKVTAERIVMELRNKLPQWEVEVPALKVVGGGASDAMADAEAALIGLGYKPQEASRALAQVEDEGADVETLIRQALKGLSS